MSKSTAPAPAQKSNAQLLLEANEKTKSVKSYAPPSVTTRTDDIRNWQKEKQPEEKTITWKKVLYAISIGMNIGTMLYLLLGGK